MIFSILRRKESSHFSSSTKVYSSHTRNHKLYNFPIWKSNIQAIALIQVPVFSEHLMRYYTLLFRQCMNSAPVNFLGFDAINNGVGHRWEDKVNLGHDCLEQ